MFIPNKFLKIFSAALLILLTLAGCSKGNNATDNTTSPNFRVVMLDVGQGDSILIQTGKKNILVDSSTVAMRDTLLAKLKKYNVKKLDLIVATHPHADHIGGFDAIFDAIAVTEVLDSSVPHTSKLYINYLKKIKDKKIKFTQPKAGDKIDLGNNTYLEFFTPITPTIKDTSSDINNGSMVFKLLHNNFSMLFTGDIQKEAEEYLSKKYSDKLSAVVLKAPHHGSSTSSTTKFLQVVKPQAVLISCSIDNEYHHPHPSVVKRYKKSQQQIYITAQHGDIILTADTNNYNITTEKQPK